MPPVPVHSLAKPHLDKLQGLLEENTTADEREIERRAQELWHAFLGTYFTGQPVEVADGGGGVLEMTFAAADLLYDQASAPDTLVRPVIHMTVSNRRMQRRDRVSGKWMFTERLDRSWLVRVPAQEAPESTAAQTAATDPGHLARRVADQLRWLLESDETQALAIKGISTIEVTNGPRLIAAGAWHMRQVTTSEIIRHLGRRNEP